MILLDGKKLADEIKNEILIAVSQMLKAGKRPPHLAALLVGNDGGSLSYVGHKVKACEQVGFKSTLLHFEQNEVSESFLLDQVHQLNSNPEIDGFIVQLPLPKTIDAQKILMSVLPSKDVDGFHPLNMGKLALGLPTFVSATPLGITKIIEKYNIETQGKHCVVLGRSNIVGRPVSILLSSSNKYGNATVTVCHSKTSNIEAICKSADIIIAAIGIPEFVKANMIRPGAVVIDVGTTRVPDATKKSGFVLKGDVKFDEVAPLCSAITPVPGGVGPMTVVSLLLNTLQAANARNL